MALRDGAGFDLRSRVDLVLCGEVGFLGGGAVGGDVGGDVGGTVVGELVG